MFKNVVLAVALVAIASAQTVTRTTTTRRTQTSITPGQTQTVTLAGGQLLEIDSRTLQRLQNQGVDINNLQNLSDDELQRLGISLQAQDILIPGAVQLPSGSQEITLRNGVILEIDRATLQRLQSQGVDVNTIPNLTDADLERLGISVRTDTIVIPGAVQVSDDVQEIRLRNGAILELTQTQLKRLQSQGVDISSIPTLTETEAKRLGIRVKTITILVPGSRQLAGGLQEITLRNGAVLTLSQGELQRLQSQGVNTNNLTNMTEAELRRVGVTVKRGPGGDILIPGAVQLAGGIQQVTLKNGDIIVIDQLTLQRLRSEGVRLSSIPNLTPDEAADLGINIRSDTIIIPGAVQLSDDVQEIRLRNGAILEITQTQLKRLQSQGVDINRIPTMSESEARRLGITIRAEKKITVPGAKQLPNDVQEISLRSGVKISLSQATLLRLRAQGVNTDDLPNKTVAELRRLGVTIKRSGGTIRIPGAVQLAGGAQQITLSNGIILVIDQETLQRLQSEGVDISSIPNLTPEEAARLGINIRTDTIVIPGAVQLSDGVQEITLRSGAILSITQTTLQRLQSQGVDINNLPNLSEAELRRLGITLRSAGGPVRVPGATQVAGGGQQIRLRNGAILVIDQATLQRLQSEGVDINNLQNLTDAELSELGIQLSTDQISSSLRPGATRRITINRRTIVISYQTLLRLQELGYDIDNLQALTQAELIQLGIISGTEQTGINGSPLRPGTTRRITVNGRVIVISYQTLLRVQDLGYDIDNLQSLSQSELIQLGIIAAPAPRPGLPQDEGSAGGEGEGEEPKPEPFNFAYTSETADGASSTHEASQTADGVVTGFYIIKEPSGQERRVDYIADANGYRATVTTNEIGTESQNSADAVFISSAPTAAELSLQHTAEQEKQERLPVPAAARRVIGQARSPTPLVRIEGSGRRRTAARLVASPVPLPASGPSSRESAASEEAGVQYAEAENGREYEAVKIA